MVVADAGAIPPQASGIALPVVRAPWRVAYNSRNALPKYRERSDWYALDMGRDTHSPPQSRRSTPSPAVWERPSEATARKVAGRLRVATDAAPELGTPSPARYTPMADAADELASNGGAPFGTERPASVAEALRAPPHSLRSIAIVCSGPRLESDADARPSMRSSIVRGGPHPTNQGSWIDGAGAVGAAVPAMRFDGFPGLTNTADFVRWRRRRQRERQRWYGANAHEPCRSHPGGSDTVAALIEERQFCAAIEDRKGPS